MNSTFPPILNPIGRMLAHSEREFCSPPVRGADSTPIVFRQCAWCHHGLGVALAVIREAGSISHGVCPECKKEFLRNVNQPRTSCRNSHS
jgi:hypothetical protein